MSEPSTGTESAHEEGKVEVTPEMIRARAEVILWSVSFEGSRRTAEDMAKEVFETMTSAHQDEHSG